jgi:hypothetical protein
LAQTGCSSLAETHTVDARLVFALLLKCAEQVVPEKKYADIIAVDVNIILSVMDPMVRGSLNPPVQDPKPADMPCVGPELVKESYHTHSQENS